jgi:hypothetical protein
MQQALNDQNTADFAPMEIDELKQSIADCRGHREHHQIPRCYPDILPDSPAALPSGFMANFMYWRLLLVLIMTFKPHLESRGATSQRSYWL